MPCLMYKVPIDEDYRHEMEIELEEDGPYMTVRTIIGVISGAIENKLKRDANYNRVIKERQADASDAV